MVFYAEIEPMDPRDLEIGSQDLEQQFEEEIVKTSLRMVDRKYVCIFLMGIRKSGKEW